MGSRRNGYTGLGKVLIVVLLPCSLASCDWPWPLDRVDDPVHCVPACSGGRVCRGGRCVSWDSGPVSDGHLDAPAGDKGNRDGPAKDRGSSSPDKGPYDMPPPPPKDKTSPPADKGGPPADVTNPCGNGKVDPGEQCDKTDLGGKTCKGLGHAGGSLTCTPLCQLSLAGCYTVGSATGTALEKGTGEQNFPAVAWNSVGYLVVWMDKAGSANRIRAARVSATGALVGLPFTVEESTILQPAYPAVACLGGTCLVVWHDAINALAKRVNAAGVVLDKVALSIATSGRYPVVAAGGSGFLVAYQVTGASFDVHAARITTGLGLLDPGGIPVSVAVGAAEKSPAVAFTGQDYLVVWEDSRIPANGWDIYSARVDVKGAVLDKAGVPLSTVSNTQYKPRVSHDSGETLVVWLDARGGGSSLAIYGTRVSAAGAALDPGGLQLVAPGISHAVLALSSGGGGHQLVWAETSLYGGTIDLFGTRLGPGAQVLTAGGFTISSQKGTQSFPAVARGTGGYLAAWNDDRDGTYNIYAVAIIP